MVWDVVPLVPHLSNISPWLSYTSSFCQMVSLCFWSTTQSFLPFNSSLVVFRLLKVSMLNAWIDFIPQCFSGHSLFLLIVNWNDLTWSTSLNRWPTKRLHFPLSLVWKLTVTLYVTVLLLHIQWCHINYKIGI